uniref:Class I SAM-dependent methyltransferase n=1 Tax=Candidatus Desulfatibia profunda TaxID=2841695 RepID=A0A8J6TGL6_9BACT|nr:class I SAM-dependent methyltransferase [Candidatus Desulfatibia profunda]
MGGYKKQLKGLHHDIDGPMVVCPFCKADFDYMDDEAHCHKCGKVFSAKNGILCFGSEDAFYEGKFTETKDWSLGQNSGMKKIFKAFYRSISIGAFESRFLSKQLKKIIHGDQAWILDFGCGGGAGILPEHGYVTGVDLSVSSLLEARRLYNRVYQIDGEHLPFPDASFDCVYTSHVFGHIPLHQKSSVINEIYRVLKPGGYLLSSIECDSESIVYKRAKKHPELFSKCYVEEYGHYGLELPDANFKRFRKAGFLPVVELADIHKGYLRPVTSYRNLVAFKGKDAVLFSLGAIANWIEKSRVITRTIDFVFGLMIPVSFLFTPPSHRDSAKIVYRKPE